MKRAFFFLLALGMALPAVAQTTQSPRAGHSPVSNTTMDSNDTGYQPWFGEVDFSCGFYPQGNYSAFGSVNLKQDLASNVSAAVSVRYRFSRLQSVGLTFGTTVLEGHNTTLNGKEFATYYFVGPSYGLTKKLSRHWSYDLSGMLGYAYLDNRLYTGAEQGTDKTDGYRIDGAHGMALNLKSTLYYGIGNGMAIGITAGLTGFATYKWKNNSTGYYLDPWTRKNKNNLFFPSIGLSYRF